MPKTRRCLRCTARLIGVRWHLLLLLRRPGPVFCLKHVDLVKREHNAQAYLAFVSTAVAQKLGPRTQGGSDGSSRLAPRGDSQRTNMLQRFGRSLTLRRVCA